ncbi:MAG: DUF4012 domain-containing protein [Patescibacteria group bacterium]|nr:DUF4012 domain-containing protein [Patescibacteria group bacterium]
MNSPKKKKKPVAKKVWLNQSAQTIQSGRVPDTNVINLRELMLQKEIEKLKTELQKKKSGSGIGRLKDWAKNLNSKPGPEKASEPLAEIEMVEPAAFGPDKQRSAKAKKSVKFEFPKPRLRLEPARLKPLAIFVVVCLALVLPIFGFWGYQHLVELRGRIVNISIKAFDQLVLAGEAATESDYNLAQERFSDASDTFLLAEKELNRMGGTLFTLLKYIPFKGKVLASGEHLLEAGQAIALAGQDVTRVIELINPEVAAGQNLLAKNDLTKLLKDSRSLLQPARDRISEANKHLQEVEVSALPENYQSEMRRVRESLPLLQQDFDKFLTFSEVFYSLLGGEAPKRYLLIFQNNREMRATGGFIGSLALVDIDQGQLVKLEVPGGGSYDLQGQLKEHVISPGPLHLVNPHWYIQDANWFPDFPASAQKIMWFYEKSGGPTVDGIISLTPDVIIDLLKITGSIDMQEKYGVTVTSENFIDVTLNEVENEYDRATNQPKQFIADLVPVLLQKVFAGDQKQFFTILEAFSDALSNRDLLFYLGDEAAQKKINELDWAGEVKQTSGDYLMVVNSNISGGKTDAVIDQTVSHEIEIKPGGETIASVEITRVHNGLKDDPWTGVKNIDFLRLYVPRGSTLLEAEGFTQPDAKLFQWPADGYENDPDLTKIEGQVIIDERTGTRINDEFGKTVFGNWVQVEPGSSVTVKLVYRLPFTVRLDNVMNNSAPYSLLVQKQSGSFDSVFHSRIHYPDDYQITWQWPESSKLKSDDEGIILEDVLKNDIYFGVVFEK